MSQERHNFELEAKPTRWRAGMIPVSLAPILIMMAFWLTVSAILIIGRYSSGYHLGQYVAKDIRARVECAWFDSGRFEAAQQRAREQEPRVYRATGTFSWSILEEQMKHWPDLITARASGDNSDVLRSVLDPAAQQLLAQYQLPDKRAIHNQRVEAFIASLKKLVLIPADQLGDEDAHRKQARSMGAFSLGVLDSVGHEGRLLGIDEVRAVPATAAFEAEIARSASDCFRDDLAPQLAKVVAKQLVPTHQFDNNATLDAQTKAASVVLNSEGEVHFKAGAMLKPARGEINDRDLAILQTEHHAYLASLGTAVWVRDLLGQAGMVAIVTLVLAAYVRRYQPRIQQNYVRGIALAVLLVSMLLLALLAASGTRPLYLFGVAPAVLAAMVIAIAYEPRFSLGLSAILSLMTALELNQGIAFLVVPLAGGAAACALVGTVRTRGRLIEIGIVSAIAMTAMTMFVGVWAEEGAQPFSYILSDAAYAGFAGLGSGFIVLGVLPFIERAFRMTTGMTLVELSDSSHPLQRKLAAEAPGTYSHSLQVATLAEAAAEAIGANAMLTRVGALYHDIGKIRRPHYFCENQSHGDNAHMQLSPEVSFMIIIEHIKDGMELARQHNLPTAIYPFIQQHHGTTLVEFFYHEACKAQKRTGQNDPPQESQFRYPGPRPRSKETALVMLADACESATRALDDPTPETVEKLVHQLLLKRLLDGQLAECDLTLKELDMVEKNMVKTLQSIHHGRIAYPDARDQGNLPQAAAGR